MAVVVVQLAEGLLMVPEVSGSNTVIGEFFIFNIKLLSTVLKGQKLRKRGREWPISKFIRFT